MIDGNEEWSIGEQVVWPQPAQWFGNGGAAGVRSRLRAGGRLGGTRVGTGSTRGGLDLKG